MIVCDGYLIESRMLRGLQDNGKYGLKRKHDDTLSDELLTMLKVGDVWKPRVFQLFAVGWWGLSS